MEPYGVFLVVLAAIGLVIAILWICLPFAVFGVKPLLEQLLAEARTTNDLLRRLVRPPDTK